MGHSSFPLIQPILALDIAKVLLGVVGVALNVVLFAANARRSPRSSTDRGLLSLTAVIDLVLGAHTICATLVRIARPELVTDGSVWCAFSYILGHTAAVASVDMVALLSLVRYLSIARGHRHRSRLWVAIAFGLLVALCAVDLARIASSQLYVYPSAMYCAPLGTVFSPLCVALSYVNLLFSFPPLLVIPTCYFLVALFYRRGYIDMYGGELPRVAFRRLLGLLAVVVGYALVILPKYTMVVLFRLTDRVPSPALDATCALLFNGVPIINALFPLLFHQEIRASLFLPKTPQ